jgi:murein L,D-transpeptidase YafK
MRILRIILVVLAGVLLTACSSKFKTYTGPTVTGIEVHKAERKMYLLHEGKVLKTYKIHLGGNPIGHKQFEGDKKTPEGVYFINKKNPNSTYHLSLQISYPNDDDRAYAASQGKEPGGDIFIHGGPPKKVSGRPRTPRSPDWTAGCIAVSDREIEDIYSMIQPNTPIRILP